MILLSQSSRVFFRQFWKLVQIFHQSGTSWQWAVTVLVPFASVETVFIPPCAGSHFFSPYAQEFATSMTSKDVADRKIADERRLTFGDPIDLQKFRLAIPEVLQLGLRSLDASAISFLNAEPSLMRERVLYEKTKFP